MHLSTSLKRHLPNKMMLSGDFITSEGKIDPVLWAHNSPHVRETKTVLDSGFHALDSGFQGPGFRIPYAKISRIFFIWGPTNIHFLSVHFCKSIFACYAKLFS